jgi:hypothetical protein
VGRDLYGLLFNPLNQVLATTFPQAPDVTPYRPSGWDGPVVVTTQTGSTSNAATVTPADTVYVDWAVSNQDKAAATHTFHTRLFLDGNLVTTWQTTPPLNANTYTAVRDFSLGKLARGTHTLLLVTDAQDELPELDASNNAFIKIFTVSWPPIALAQAPQVNGGSAALAGAQRSMVDSIAYTFNHPVTLGANAVSIALHQNVTVNGTGGQAVGTLPTLAWSSADGGVTWVVTFSGNGVVGGSIADGVYDLTLNHAAITDAQGQALAADRVDTFYRLYGDSNGDGTVNNADTFQLRKTFGAGTGDAAFLAYLDATGDGTVNNADVFQYRRRFGTTFSGFTTTI